MNKKIIIPIFVALALFTITYAYMTTEAVSITFISGTEYQQGEVGQVIIRTLNGFGLPITANQCNITIGYPNGSVWINNQPMTQSGITAGTWRYQFTTPFTAYGVYEEYVVCKIPTARGVVTRGAGSSFHVSQALTTINDTASAQVVIIS